MVKLTASDIFHPGAMAWGTMDLLNVGMRRPQRFHRTHIREWREHRGLTLEQLAERIDMTASHLSMLERGQRGYTQETLEIIAHALQTDTSSLLARNPGDSPAIWSVWDKATPAEREMISEIVKSVIKPRR